MAVDDYVAFFILLHLHLEGRRCAQLRVHAGSRLLRLRGNLVECFIGNQIHMAWGNLGLG